VPALLALTGLGFALMVSLRDPWRDLLLFAPFAQGVALGCAALAAIGFVDLERSVLPRLSYVPLAAALLLSILLVTLGRGPAGSDARVNLFGVQNCGTLSRPRPGGGCRTCHAARTSSRWWRASARCSSASSCRRTSGPR